MAYRSFASGKGRWCAPCSELIPHNEWEGHYRWHRQVRAGAFKGPKLTEAQVEPEPEEPKTTELVAKPHQPWVAARQLGVAAKRAAAALRYGRANG